VTAAEEVFGDQYELISRYVDLLGTKGVEWGLIGPREQDRLWDRHVLNSVALEGLLPQGSTVADVGSGAGLPGIPLAILRPDLQVTLVEPLLRRATFLTETLDELDLHERVAVVRARAEDHRGQYDGVVSRALAPLERLVSWCDPLRSPAGSILALKGRTAADELAAAARTLARRRLTGEVLTVRAHADTQPTTALRLVETARH